MSQAFQTIAEADVAVALAERLVPSLSELLRERGPGHCMRVSDLDDELMASLCADLRQAVPDGQVWVLARDGVDDAIRITSTKLVELRNPNPDGTQRAPLMVFLPANVRASAEDSFCVATFEDVVVSGVYTDLEESLLGRFAPEMSAGITDVLATLREERWPWADDVARVRFLLTAVRNGADPEATGASVYELGLVPDPKLLAENASIRPRLRSNMRCVTEITDSHRSIRARVTALDISDSDVANSLTDLLLREGVEDPRRWQGQIVSDRRNHALLFDRWSFERDRATAKVRVEVVSIDLPTVREDETEEHLVNLVGQPYLATASRQRMAVEFQSTPSPQNVPGLNHFIVAIVSQDDGTTRYTRRARAWEGSRTGKRMTLDKLHLADLDEGWHFVRVIPCTEHGDPVPLDEPSYPDDPPARRINESEAFYVVPGAIVDADEPPARGLPKAASVEHARLLLQFRAVRDHRDPDKVVLRSVGWSASSRHGVADSLTARFGTDGTYQIPVSNTLRDLERQIVTLARCPSAWRIALEAGSDPRVEATPLDIPDTASAEAFLDAREAYLRAVAGPQQDGITQRAELLVLKDLSIAYAESYASLLADLRSRLERVEGPELRRALADLRTVLGIDCARVSLRDYQGHLRHALLVGPTHPLRAAWLVTWASLAKQWVTQAERGPEDYLAPVQRALTDGLVPLDMPFALPAADGRVFVTADNVHPFWTLYAPPDEEDVRGLLGEVCAHLGVAEPPLSGATVTGEVLGARLARFLVQNPYIRTLSVNAFNPGSAAVLADALVWLQRQGPFAALRYDVRLFVADPEAAHVGEGLDRLLSPTSAVTHEAVDAFCRTTGSHLFPKLTVAVRSLEDFHADPARHRAHVSMLFDMFPARGLSAMSALSPYPSTALHGLVQDTAVDFRDDEAGAFWFRQPRHGPATPMPGDEDLVGLLASLPEAMSLAMAAVATGSPGGSLLPTSVAGLDPSAREMLHHVHEVSNWVFTIDRNIGVDFFDHGGRRNRPEYLVDYVPGAATDVGHRLIITSRSMEEIEAALRPLLHDRGLPDDQDTASRLFRDLRALSGRLALKLVSALTQQIEALGLALARRFLEYEGALENQIVVPLDSHLELLRGAKEQADPVRDAVSLQRTDLALFDLNATDRVITCNLIEVKCYAQVGGIGSFNELKHRIAGQIAQSEDALRRHFDPLLRVPDRPDRLLKTRELARLLEFYLGRARRHGLMGPEAAEEARYLLATLEDGYALRFTRSGVIFDFQSAGMDTPEVEEGVEFHRIGIDLIGVLASMVTPSQPSPAHEPGAELLAPEPSIHRLPSAAFLVPKRDRSADWTKRQRTRPSEGAPPKKPDDSEGSSGGAGPAVVPPSQPGPAGSTPPDEQAPSVGDRIEGSAEPGVPSSPAGPSAAPPAAVEGTAAAPEYSVLLGVQQPTPQFGLVGEVAGRKVALDMNQTHTISLFGVQGGGKSYTLGSIIEMACMPIPGINALPSPLATVVFHYSPTQDYKPEFTSMVRPNDEATQIASLHERYRAEPKALGDVLILAPSAKVDDRQAEYPGVRVLPIAFAASEMKAMHWKFLMGAVGSQSMYLRQINLVMRTLRENLTLDALRTAVESSSMTDHLKDLARTRLDFAAEYIDDTQRISAEIRPGRLIIVDLRDEYIEKDEALGLFVVLLQIFSEATFGGQQFNKLVVFDEAHKYIENADLIAGLVEVVREMRHKGTSILVASQDPPSVPISLIELSTQIILHKMNSPAWLKHIQRANAALSTLTAERMSSLGAGEAYVWSSKATDDQFTRGAVKVKLRPRVTLHGGETKTAV
jgi:hypothetical protein